MMQAELICVGSELLSGKLNTHASYLGEKLFSIGLALSREETLPDVPAVVSRAIREACARSSLILVTGGLGPTFDDITRKAAAEALGKRLILRREILKGIAQHFSQRKIRMPKENESQAYILEGARVLLNRAGTAPGQLLEIEGKVVALFPGPPRELYPMMEEILPFLKERFSQGIRKKIVLRIVGMAESQVDEKIRNLINRERAQEGSEVSFSILAHASEVHLSISLSGRDELLVDDVLQKIRREFYEVLGKAIYAEDGKTLEAVVGEMFIRQRKSLALAESCTGGLIANRLTNIPGSSLYFRESLVVYSNHSKIRLTGVSPETLEREGAVSRRCALEMARGIREAAKTDWGLSVTGIAGPNPSSTGKPVGLVFMALKGKEAELCEEHRFLGNRLEIKERASSAALDFLRRTCETVRRGKVSKK